MVTGGFRHRHSLCCVIVYSSDSMMSACYHVLICMEKVARLGGLTGPGRYVTIFKMVFVDMGNISVCITFLRVIQEIEDISVGVKFFSESTIS